MIHFSVDDTIELFHYLNENGCTSIFDDPRLNYFKSLHDKYGLKASMYCFYEMDGFDLSMCTDRYRKQFEDNADWLRFGFHGRDERSKYFGCDERIFKADLLATVNELKRIVSEAAITYDVRLGFGQGNRGCIRVMKESFDQFKVLYGVDDGRIVYYLTEEENRRYLAEGTFYDERIGITLKHCERRLESNERFMDRVKEMNTDQIYPFFTHEICLNNERVLEYLRVLCESGQQFVL